MKTDPWEDDLTIEVAGQFPEAALTFASYVGQQFLTCPLEAVGPLLSALKNNLRFEYLVDVTAVDYPQRAPRFDLIYIVYNFESNRRIRVETSVADGAEAASVTSIYKTADWLEREVYDMFGIRFAGHPNLKRILMPEEWTGFPLRKDYSIIRQDQAWVQENLGIESGQ